MPIPRCRHRRESPPEIVPSETLLNDGIVRDINTVIKPGKSEVGSLGERQNGDQDQAGAD